MSEKFLKTNDHCRGAHCKLWITKETEGLILICIFQLVSDLLIVLCKSEIRLCMMAYLIEF